MITVCEGAYKYPILQKGLHYEIAIVSEVFFLKGLFWAFCSTPALSRTWPRGLLATYRNYRLVVILGSLPTHAAQHQAGMVSSRVWGYWFLCVSFVSCYFADFFISRESFLAESSVCLNVQDHVSCEQRCSGRLLSYVFPSLRNCDSWYYIEGELEKWTALSLSLF